MSYEVFVYYLFVCSSFSDNGGNSSLLCSMIRKQ